MFRAYLRICLCKLQLLAGSNKRTENEKVKLSLLQAEEAHRFVRRRGCHTLQIMGLTDGGEAVSISTSPLAGTHFCLRLSLL
jgi:hypothetical protein